MIRVLFVCAGNTCRSPMAERLFAHRVEEADLSGYIMAASAGVAAHAGDPTHPETLRVLAEHGISAEEGRARLLAASDLTEFDLIAGMDSSTLEGISALAGSPAGHLLMDFVAGAEGSDVPDPFGTDRYDEVFALIDQAVDGLLAHLVEVHGL